MSRFACGTAKGGIGMGGDCVALSLALRLWGVLVGALLFFTLLAIQWDVTSLTL